MIRSNPTAIPLRASDVKHLQATIEQRKQQSSAEGTAAPDGSTKQSGGGQNEGAVNKGKGSGSGGTPAYSEVEQRKRDKAAMTTEQRIGL